MRRSQKYQNALTMLEVAEKIGETGVSKRAVKVKVTRQLRRLERRAGARFLFRESNILKITPYGLAKLLEHRRDQEQERADDVAQIVEELNILKRRQNALAASGRRLAKEVETLRAALKSAHIDTD
jgi:hypothetical protein